jgi:DNA ligase-1
VLKRACVFQQSGQSVRVNAFAAKDLMHGRDWPGFDVIGWTVTEKLDGCRAVWTGTRLITRTGRAIDAPEWFTRGLPAMVLDGEIWAGRGEFEAARQAVQHGRFSAACEFVVFDAPLVGGDWECRILSGRAALSSAPCACAVQWTVCHGMPWLRERLAAVQRLGGEGLMVRRPGSLYEAGRSSSLLKIKSWRGAAE